MKSQIEKTSQKTMIRKKQPTNFAQKARISNQMRKEANYKVYEYQKRIDPIVKLNCYSSILNTFNSSGHIDLNYTSDIPLSPNSSFNQKNFSPKAIKTSRANSKIRSKAENNVNSFKQKHRNFERPNAENDDINVEHSPQNKQKPRYSLYKRNDE